MVTGRASEGQSERVSTEREIIYKELHEDYREYPEDRACKQSSIVIVN